MEIDKLRFQAAASLSPVDALQSLGNPEYLVLDEAQRLPQTGRVVKGWYDARLPVKIRLLGSSSLELLNRATESLTGRNEKLFLPPLFIDEVIRSREWCPVGRAFRSMYGLEVEMLDAGNPFAVANALGM